LKPENNPTNNTRGFLKYTTMAFQMIATILVFLFLGRFLDSRFAILSSLKNGHHSAFPLFTFICTLLGLSASLYLVIKSLKK